MWFSAPRATLEVCLRVSWQATTIDMGMLAGKPTCSKAVERPRAPVSARGFAAGNSGRGIGPRNPSECGASRTGRCTDRRAALFSMRVSERRPHGGIRSERLLSVSYSQTLHRNPLVTASKPKSRSSSARVISQGAAPSANLGRLARIGPPVWRRGQPGLSGLVAPSWCLSVGSSGVATALQHSSLGGHAV